MFKRVSPSNLSKSRTLARWVQLLCSVCTIISLCTGFIDEFSGGITFGVVINIVAFLMAVYYLVVVRRNKSNKAPSKAKMRILDIVELVLLVGALSSQSTWNSDHSIEFYVSYTFMVIHFFALVFLILLSCAPDSSATEPIQAPIVEAQPNVVYEVRTAPLAKPNQQENQV